MTPEIIRDAFHQTVRALRTKRGLSVCDLADRMGSTHAQVWRYEHSHTPQLSQLFKLCEALNVDPGVFVANMQRRVKAK